MLSTISGDFRYVIRTLSRTPRFSLVVVLTLAIGVSVNVALFSLFQQVLLRPLSVNAPGQLVNFTDPGPDPGRTMTRGSLAGEGDAVFSYPMFRDLERAQEPLEGIAAHRMFDASVSNGEQAQLEEGMFVSGAYFSLLGLQPAVGRLLDAQDDSVDGRADAVVVSYAYWQSQFAGEQNAVGQILFINGTPLTIVGVAPPGFDGTTVGTRASVFVPISFPGGLGPASLPNHDNRGAHWVHLFGRLKSGYTREQAAAAINPLYRSINNEIEATLIDGANEQELAAFRTKSLALEPGELGQSVLMAPARAALKKLLAVSGTVLLLCCANIAGLILVRGCGRRGEMAVRHSLGATRGRLVALHLSESLVLAVPAAGLSLFFAWLTLRAMSLALPNLGTDAGLIAPGDAFDVSLSGGAGFFAIAVALVSALIFGLIPARDLMRTNPASEMQTLGTRQTSARHVTRFRTALATVQVAISMALLALTGIFALSLMNISRVDIGLDVGSVATFTISPSTSGYAPEAGEALYDRLEQELSAIPGVSSVGLATFPLLTGSMYRMDGLEFEGEVLEGVNANLVSSGFRETLGINLIAGRDFSIADDAGAPQVVIVNQSFADRLGLGGNIVGRRITSGPDSFTIVGLIANSVSSAVTSQVGPQLFQPRDQSFLSAAIGFAAFYVRSSLPPTELLGAIRTTAARVDAIVPITALRTMEQQVNENLATERFMTWISAAFAVLATLLAGVGLFGMLAYSVAERSRELALRMALGASAGRIRTGVFRQVLSIALVGIAIGTTAALWLGRAAANLLFDVNAGDPFVLASAATILLLVVLLAGYLPARRASRVDPMCALRYE